MKLVKIPTGAFEANCFLLETADGRAVLFDPGADAPTILERIHAEGWVLDAVFLTHGHVDHLSALADLSAAFPSVPVHLAAADAAWAFTDANAFPPYGRPAGPPAALKTDVAEGATFVLGDLTLRVLATPGHSPGSVCYLVTGPEADGTPALFSGDTLFRGSIGRTDFAGGDDAAMVASLRRLVALPPETNVHPGHGPSTTIADERARNPYLRPFGWGR